ncbi:hypothetical protein KJ632_05865 [Patescibacteria group bacterium]|nr:hypothetical protein [Patescibacteria group bacterium]
MWSVQKGRKEKWPGIRYGMDAKNALTTALRPTPGSSAALRGKVIGGAAYAERYA